MDTMADLTDDQLDRIEAHARGGLPPGDGEHYVSLLVAEVRRLREAVGYRDERLARWKSVWRRGRDHRLTTEAERDRLLDGIREVIGYGVVFDAKGTHSKRVVRRLQELLDDQEDDRE